MSLAQSTDSQAAPRPSQWSAEVFSAFFVSLVAFAWLYSRLSPGVAFGVWQGSFLSPDPLHRPPLLSQGLAWAALQLPAGNAAGNLNLLTAVFGAIACGLLAAAATRTAKTLVGPLEATFTGLAAGLFFAGTPLLTYTATGANPTTLSLFLGLASLLALYVWVDDEATFAGIAVSAALAGLASANNPAMGVLFFVVAGTCIVLPSGNHPVLRLFVVGFVFLVFAALPFAAALLRGESLREFLSHALLTAYPNIADGVPQWNFGHELLTSFSPLMLLLAVPALVGLFQPRLRRYILLAAAVLLTMGPLLPSLTNQDSGPEVLRDPVAPRLLALAAVCLLASIGVLRTVRLLSLSTHARPQRMALMVGIAFIVLIPQLRNAPDRNQTVARDVASEILEACPPDALLVCGAPGLTSIVTATQYTQGLRTDVQVLPAEFLTRSKFRARLQGHLEGLTLSPEFPSDDAVSRWAQERPLILEGLLKDGGDLRETPEALDLALWDLVMDNPKRWPICFVGVPSSWLTARAQLSGPLFCYPRRADKPSEGFLNLMKTLYANDTYARDPGVGEVMTDVLLPSSELLGRQRSADDAKQVAELAEQLGADYARSQLALSRAAARQGNKEEAAQYASEYLAAVLPSRSEQEALARTLESDLLSATLRQEFLSLVDRTRQGESSDTLRQDVTSRLWQEDDIATLAEGYRALAQSNPDDVDALYQYAAALTQLGDLPEAQRLLAQAALANPSAVGQRLQNDMTRFTLLRVYHREHNPQPADPDVG